MRAKSDATLSTLVDVNYLQTKDYIVYASALFGSSAVVGLVQSYLMIFYINVLKIPLASVGLMFLIGKIFDGLNDPIMGAVIDRTRSKWGKMRPYLMFAPIPWILVVVSMFSPINFMAPNLSTTGYIIFMYVSYFLFDMTTTAVDVPIQGICSVVSPNVQERSKIISFGRIAGSIGEQSSLVLVAVGYIIFKNDSWLYMTVSLIIGILGPLLVMYSGRILKERVPPTIEKTRIFDSFIYLFRNKQLLALISSTLLTFFRNIVTGLIYYVVTYIFLDPGKQILFALPGAAAGMLGMLLAPFLKKRLSAKSIFILATIWHAVALSGVYFIGAYVKLDMFLIAGLMFVAMIPVGVLNVTPSLMAADTIDYMEWKTGERKEGITYSLMTLRSKISSGFRDFFMTTVVLASIGFNPDGIGIPIPGREQLFMQTEQTLKGLFLWYTIIPGLLNLLSIVPMLFYKLTGEKLKTIQEQLAKKHNGENEEDEKRAIQKISDLGNFYG